MRARSNVQEYIRTQRANQKNFTQITQRFFLHKNKNTKHTKQKKITNTQNKIFSKTQNKIFTKTPPNLKRYIARNVTELT
jgi:hypothetical protein